MTRITCPDPSRDYMRAPHIARDYMRVPHIARDFMRAPHIARVYMRAPHIARVYHSSFYTLDHCTFAALIVELEFTGYTFSSLTNYSLVVASVFRL